MEGGDDSPRQRTRRIGTDPGEAGVGQGRREVEAHGCLARFAWRIGENCVRHDGGPDGDGSVPCGGWGNRGLDVGGTTGKWEDDRCRVFDERRRTEKEQEKCKEGEEPLEFG